MDNYIMLNGKKIELTDEQINLIMSSENDKIGNCFDRVKNGSKYYFIDCDGSVDSYNDDYCTADTDLYNIANYCLDEKIMKQRALHEILNRLLWRFSIINGGDKINWLNFKDKFFIYYNYENNEIEINYNTYCQSSAIYFYSEEIAQRAIDEIITPFMNEHPEFIW